MTKTDEENRMTANRIRGSRGRHGGRIVFWLIGCFAFVAGCGTSDVAIEGTVTLDGQPLADVQVLFDQPKVKDGNSFAGRTDAEGHYVLKAIREELTEPVAGEYRVSLTTAVAGRDALEHTPLPKERIPKKYRGGQLTFELPESGTNEANFELRSK